MKRLMILFVLSSLFVTGHNTLQAQELLSNGNLNATHQVPPGSEALYWPEFVGWTMVTDPCSYSPCPITPYVPGAFYTQYSGYPATFANMHGTQNPNAKGLIGTSFEGYYPFEIVGAVDIEITQTQPAIPGQTYRFSGWAHFEGGYSGGVDFLDPLSPNQRKVDAEVTNPGVPVASLTQTLFTIEFLDGGGNVIPGSSTVYDLHDDGGQVNDNELDGRTWFNHKIYGTAPAGAASIRVRAGMIDGEFNVDDPHQSVFFDNFSLRAVPEPTTSLLALFGLTLLGGVRRRR